MEHNKIPKYFGITFIVILLCGLGYGLWHDFTPEYEAAHPIQYDMVVYDEQGNETIIRDLEHTNRSQNYRILPGGVIMPLTQLDADGLKVQEEDGCIACHERR